MQPDAKTKPAPDDPKQERRDRLGSAALLWGSLTLSGIAALSGLAIWHLIRRGRLLREGAVPPRKIEWPEPPSDPQNPTAP